MAIKAVATISLSTIRDISSIWRFYCLQPSTAAAPSTPDVATTAAFIKKASKTNADLSSTWVHTEPTYTTGSTNSLYTLDLTIYTDDTYSYSSVCLSSSYEAAKAAYNKATQAQNAAESGAKTATNFVTEKGTGGQILVHPEGDTKNAVLIGQDVQIIRNGVTVATYSDDVRIGKADSAHAGISESGMTVYSAGGADKVAEFGKTGVILGAQNQKHAEINNTGFLLYRDNINVMARIGDQKNTSGLSTLTEKYEISGQNGQHTLLLKYRCESIIGVYVNWWEDGTKEVLSTSKITLWNDKKTFDVDSSVFNVDLYITYQTQESVYGVTFFDSEVSGDECFVVGNNNIVDGVRCNAIGSNNTVGGYGVTAIGNNLSCADGFVVGQYNDPDVTGAIFQIGNGEPTTQGAYNHTAFLVATSYIGMYEDFYVHKNQYVTGNIECSGRITSGKESTEIALSNGASGYVYLHRKGDIASVYITGAKLGAGTVNRTIATLPEGWRPVRQTGIPIDGSSDALLFINPDGTISCRYNSSTQRQIWGRVTYIAWN